MSTPADDPGQLIALKDVPAIRWLPLRRKGSKLHIATVHRWASHGVRGIRLQITSAGGTRCTTEQWLKEFFVKCAASETERASEPSKDISDAHRQSSAPHRNAIRQLQAAGI